MVQLDIKGFRSGVEHHQRALASEELDIDPSDFDGIEFEAELNREGERILVRYTISGTAHLTCDRTSEPFDLPVAGQHLLLFVPEDRVEQMGEESDDVLGYVPTDEMLDLTVSLRDTLMLAVPTRKIAPGAEDVDIDTEFGTPEADEIDPRWEALRRLSDTPPDAD